MLGILKKPSVLILILLIVSSFFVLPVRATSGYLDILEDSHTESADVNANFATSALLIVQGASVSGVCWTWFMINVSSLPTYVQSAHLELYAVHNYGWSMIVSAYNTTTNWNEGNITWSNQPLVDEVQDFEQPIPINGANGQAGFLEITDAVISAQANGEENVSIVVTCSEINTWMYFPSTEDTEYTYHNRVYYILSDNPLPSPEATPGPTNTPTTQDQDQTAFFQIIVPIACIGIPALIMAAFLGKWGFITGATLGATFGFITLPGYIPYWVPLFVGLGTVAILFMSFRST